MEKRLSGFIKVIIVSYSLSSLIFILIQKITDIILSNILNYYQHIDLFPILSLVGIFVLFLNLFMIWPLSQTKLFIFFARKFNLKLWPTTLFHFISVSSFEISILAGVYFAGRLIGTPKLTYFGYTTYELNSRSIQHIVTYLFVVLTLYAPFLYFAVDRSTKKKSN